MRREARVCRLCCRWFTSWTETGGDYCRSRDCQAEGRKRTGTKVAVPSVPPLSVLELWWMARRPHAQA